MDDSSVDQGAVNVSGEDPSAQVGANVDIDDPMFTPESHEDLDAALAEICKRVPDEKISEFYDNVMSVLEDTLSVEDTKAQPPEPKQENVKRKKSLKTEAKKDYDEPQSKMTQEEMEAVATSIEQSLRKLKESEIAALQKEFGIVSSHISGITNRAANKLAFMAMLLTKQSKKFHKFMDEMIDEYIEFLKSSEALEPEEIHELYKNPWMVAELDGFREFLDKEIQELAKSMDMRVGYIPRHKKGMAKPEESAPGSVEKPESEDIDFI